MLHSIYAKEDSHLIKNQRKHLHLHHLPNIIKALADSILKIKSKISSNKIAHPSITTYYLYVGMYVAFKKSKTKKDNMI